MCLFLTSFEHATVGALMFQDLQDTIALETSSFSTMQTDKFDFDGAAARFTDVSVPGCFVAIRVHSSDLQPEHLTHENIFPTVQP